VLGGRYRIDRLIGEGGMGAVYKAEHTHMHKRLAVKVLHPEMSRLPEVVARFEREAMAAAHIEHPNVAGATDFGKLDDGSFFLVLEYVEGRSLRDAMSEGRLEIGRALHIARQIASALSRAHALGIVHRDLKPENVMLVSRDDDADFVKVLDFGIAKVPVGELAGRAGESQRHQPLTQLGMVYGTPEYMAPEQALGQPVDPRADLYSLGIILFEMIAGVRPYDHESKVTLLGMHLTAAIPRLNDRAPDVDGLPEIDAIVTKLLAKDASGRFADAKALIEAIHEATAKGSARRRIAERASMPGSPIGPPGSAPRVGSGSGSVEASTAPASLGVARLARLPRRTLRQLASRVRPWIDRVARAEPPWAERPRVLVASGLAALLAAGLVVGAFAGGERGGVAPAAPANTAAAPPKPPPVRAAPRIDDVVAAAQVHIDKGDFTTAVEQLTAIEKANPDRADVHMRLEKAYTGLRNGHEAMREAAAWLASDPTAAADPKLEEDVRNAALLRETQEEAFPLLEAKMGTVGADILYDLAYGQSGKMVPAAAARARRSLLANDVRGRASPGLAVLLDLREARTCEARHSLLERARDQGDVRVLAMLQQYEAPRGCGFLAMSDCYPCMRKDDLLAQAIAGVEVRSAKAP
jgi:serine/threonine-protein kinase